jgi:glycosyltransferase involved in cell wall biosynthesis
MTYYERQRQLRNTLDSFVYHGYKDDVEVIIVDDGSKSQKASDILAEKYPFKIRIIYNDPRKKWYTNPCIPFNQGIKHAVGDVIMLQNAECMHVHPIALHAQENIRQNEYLSYGCYSINEEQLNAIDGCKTFQEKLGKVAIVSRPVSSDGDDGWYNHSVYRPVGYHFCSAITRENLLKLGGFDERYARGVGYDDDEILHRIKSEINLRVAIIDTHIVFHQWHYVSRSDTPRARRLKRRNENLYRFMTCGRLPYRLVPFIALYEDAVSACKRACHKTIK